MDVLKSGLIDHWTWRIYLKFGIVDVHHKYGGIKVISNKSPTLSFRVFWIFMRKILFIYPVAILLQVIELIIYGCASYLQMR